MFKKNLMIMMLLFIIFSCSTKSNNNENIITMKTIIKGNKFTAKIPYKDKLINGILIENIGDKEIKKEYKNGFLKKAYNKELEKIAKEEIKEYEAKNTLLGEPLYIFYDDAKIGTVYQHDNSNRLVANVRSYYEDGTLAFKAPFKGGMLNGDFIHYEGNKKHMVTTFKDNIAIVSCSYEEDSKKNCHYFK